MSPIALRRYRAERLLRGEFDRLRSRVLATVRARLRSGGVHLDEADLEACYAQAWQGLYAALLAGQTIASPAGWLVVVTFRRAIEEHRSRLRIPLTDGPPCTIDGEPQPSGADDRELADELDDRRRLRLLFEGLQGRLSVREREAAVLCYLHGMSRSEAAQRMGVSERRMRKLMEGRRPGAPGVAAKVGAVVASIRDGAWCEEQASLMRGLAYGLLDPDGERYRLAVAHRRECPACRAYVASLRGLAAALPAPLLAPSGIAAAVLAAVRGSAPATRLPGVPRGHAAGPAAHAKAGIGPISTGGAAGAGSAGGSWVVAGGPAGAKLAVGCLLALGVGAGCAALGGSGDPVASGPVDVPGP